LTVALFTVSGVVEASPKARPQAKTDKPAKEAPVPSKGPTDPNSEAFRNWVVDAFPWGEGKLSAEDTPQGRVRGYRIVKVSKEYKFDTRANDFTFAAIDEFGRFAIVGDMFLNEARQAAPAPVKTDLDLGPISNQVQRFLRSRFKLVLDPPNDRPGFKAIKIVVDAGYGTYDIGGFIAADDGIVFFIGRSWDLRKSIPEQRKEMIKLAGVPSQGPADAQINVVEYSDMQCGFCKKRTKDWDPLLKKLEGQLKIRRYFKAFPLTEAHPWAFRASSAGRCFFEKDPKLFLAWKSNVYNRQETLTVPDIDMFALEFAGANGIGEDEFKSCYLREKSSARVLSELSEGFTVRVRATPTYFIDGVQVSWFQDDLMEEFLRKKYLKGAGLPLPARPATQPPAGGGH
jgi:protein-disulfide isomerase